MCIAGYCFCDRRVFCGNILNLFTTLFGIMWKESDNVLRYRTPQNNPR